MSLEAGAPGRPGLLKFCSPNEHALSNLRARVIYCQHYARFNDPFEFWTEFVSGIPDEKTEPERFGSAIREWGFESAEGMANDPDTAAYFDEMRLYEPPFEQMVDWVRIACFGSEPANLLMWSHYADGLRGFCVVFEETAIVGKSPEACILDVAYLDQPPVVDSFVYAIAWDQNGYHLEAIHETHVKYAGKVEQERGLGPYQEAADTALSHLREMWQQAFGTKPLAWKYENERRLIVNTDLTGEEPLLRSYPKEAVKEIIYGERMPADYLARLRTAVKDTYGDIPLRMARRSDSSYTLIIE